MKEKIKQVNDLCAANGSYVNQHGKKTVSAWSKIKYFREVFGTEYGINCVIQEHSDRYVIMKCIITKSDPEHIIATGFSKQYRDKPGYLEIAETFAITRALSFFGPKQVCAFCDIDRDGVPTDRCLSSHGTSLLENGELE